MKKVCMLFVAFTMISSSLYAQRQHDGRGRILRVLQQIENDLSYSNASMEQLRDAHKLLRQAQLIISGSSPGPTQPPAPNPRPYPPRPNPSPSFSYSCTDRDNDNRPPYVFSYTDRNFNIIKIKDFYFSSKSSCERSLHETFYVDGVQMMCIARDGDGRAPYVSVKSNSHGFQVLRNQTFHSYNSCYDSFTRRGRHYRGEFIFCTDRDSDNRAPYVMKAFNAQTGNFSTKSNQSFNSMSECEQVLYSR